MNCLFVGNAGLGGAQMRGRDVAARLGVHFCDWSKLPSGPLDAVVIVKYWRQELIADLRRRCRLLILDPLDCWTQTKPHVKPADFWRWCRGQTQCDLMLGCSPSAVETMDAGGVRAVLAPHHADERIGAGWCDHRGPVVYAGGERFLGDQRPKIEAACRELGREFVCRTDRDCWQALQGAALVLSVRFGEQRTPLNLNCKPAVKVANAARARIPMLCTTDPAVYSLCELSRVTSDAGQSAADWASDITSALAAEPPRYPWTIDTHCELLRGTIG